ncbi:MAG TPA: hypothetical protein VE570_11130, partial [Thermoleophilaceae bacterium]|jgi:hypothetical protein|nr:hypothetical protein [Thermoleophilaceae bacterium]
MLEPLALALHPLMPVRTPREGRTTVLYGYQLRLASGPVLATDDPLLAAFATSIEAVDGSSGQSEPLQFDGFDPARRVRLVREGVDGDGDEVIGVWDLEEIRRAGTLPYETAARVAAAIDHGLEIDALVLSEARLHSDGRRCGIALLVYPPALVTVDVAAGGPLQRPETRTRPRLVLIADDAAGLQWWDPSGAAGPMQLDAVPVSATVAQDLRELASAFKKAASDDYEDGDFLEDMEHKWQRHVLDERTRSVWERVRRELGRRYAIGLMLKGMTAPAWSPEEFDDEDEDDEIPF